MGLLPGFQPGENFVGVFIRRKDRIEDFRNFTVLNNPSHAFDKAKPAIFKGGELQGIDELEAGVTQDFKQEMNAMNEFFLVFRVLSAGTENLEAKRLKFPVEIAEAAGMRRAAACLGNDIPFLRNGFMRLSVPWIEKNDSWRGEFSEVDEPARGTGERNRRQGAARQMVACAIVFWFGKRGRKFRWI